MIRFICLMIVTLIAVTVLSCSTESTPAYTLITTVNPAEGGEIVPDSGTFDEGEVVSLQAIPTEGWVFVRWEQDLSSTQNPMNLKLNKDYNLVAVFEQRKHALTIDVEGEGTVTETIIQQKTTDYTEGTVVELLAEPARGWIFSHWKQDLEGDENPQQIEVNDKKFVTAFFERRKYPLTIHIQGEGVVSEEVLQAKTTEYPYQAVVQLTATPLDGWNFSHWEGDLNSSENPQQLGISTERSVTAVFERIEYTLSIVIEGEGSVLEEVVQAKAPYYPFETVVELTALPNEGWKFVNWDGDLSGTKSTYQIVIDSDKSVTAIFSKLFYLHENGVTIMCPQASPGDTGSVEGIEYKAVDRDILREMFSEGKDLSEACTSNITNMVDIFDGIQRPGWIRTKEFNDNIEKWDVSNVTDMGKMFYGATSFNQDIGKWNVSSVTDMNAMFLEASNFNQDIGGWDVNKVTDMRRMFLGALSFNQSIESWDVSNVIDMSEMFVGDFEDVSAFNQDLGNWDVSNVIDMAGMFLRATSFNQNIGDWDVSSVTDMKVMFAGASNFNQDISSWKVTSVTDMSGLFDGASNFNQNIEGWDVSNVIDMAGMFLRATSFNQAIGDWDVSSVTDMNGMFWGAYSFNQDIGEWNVSSVTDMNAMFYSSVEFNQDLSAWCVALINSRPGNFDFNTPMWVLPKPVWGMCPD